MPTLTIRTRLTATGEKRYVVRYRLGGRAYPVVHGGTFKTMKEAKVRRDLLAGEIAAGRNPAHVLQALATVPAPALNLRRWTDKFLAARLDVDANTMKNYRSMLTKVADRFGERRPEELRADDVAEWIAELAATLKPGTVKLHLVVLRMLFDYIGIDTNPARDPRVKVPKQVREEPQPPPAEHVIAILEAIGIKWRLLLIVIEQGALRLGEAVQLRWGDVDAANLRLRLPRSATKRDQARWVYLPDWLIAAVEDTCPLEDRTPERRVFQGITEAGAYQAMTRACRNAKVPHYHPHDLRHRRITIWHQSGVPARELAERAGHSKPSMSLDVYSHVMPTTEIPEADYLELIAGNEVGR
jgi:integrase